MTHKFFQNLTGFLVVCSYVVSLGFLAVGVLESTQGDYQTTYLDLPPNPQPVPACADRGDCIKTNV